MELGEQVTQAVLDDYRTADISPRLRAMLAFVQKLTKEPDDVGGADIAALHDAGISGAAIDDAVVVCVAFHTITRIADALDFAIPNDAGFARSARVLIKRGYK